MGGVNTVFYNTFKPRPQSQRPPRKTRHPEARTAHIDLADWLIEFLQDNK